MPALIRKDRGRRLKNTYIIFVILLISQFCLLTRVCWAVINLWARSSWSSVDDCWRVDFSHIFILKVVINFIVVVFVIVFFIFFVFFFVFYVFLTLALVLNLFWAGLYSLSWLSTNYALDLRVTYFFIFISTHPTSFFFSARSDILKLGRPEERTKHGKITHQKRVFRLACEN